MNVNPCTSNGNCMKRVLPSSSWSTEIIIRIISGYWSGNLHFQEVWVVKSAMVFNLASKIIGLENLLGGNFSWLKSNKWKISRGPHYDISVTPQISMGRKLQSHNVNSYKNERSGFPEVLIVSKIHKSSGNIHWSERGAVWLRWYCFNSPAYFTAASELADWNAQFPSNFVLSTTLAFPAWLGSIVFAFPQLLPFQLFRSWSICPLKGLVACDIWFHFLV